MFTGTAQAKNAKGAVSGTLEVRLRRVTPEFESKAVETALKEGGYPRFLPRFATHLKSANSCSAAARRSRFGMRANASTRPADGSSS